MKLKKANAVLGLLSAFFMIFHIGYSVFAYLTMYYNSLLTSIFSIPFMVVVCLHAILGMLTVFLQADGTRLDLYPGYNRRTILQRLSAALILPLLILHLNTFDLMTRAAMNGYVIFIILLMLAEVLFFAAVIAHIVISLPRALITLGALSSRKTQNTFERVLTIVGAVIFIVASVSVIRGQLIIFGGSY